MNITLKNDLSIVPAGSQQYLSTPKMTFYDKTNNTNNITNKIYSLLHRFSGSTKNYHVITTTQHCLSKISAVQKWHFIPKYHKWSNASRILKQIFSYKVDLLDRDRHKIKFYPFWWTLWGYNVEPSLFFWMFEHFWIIILKVQVT